MTALCCIYCRIDVVVKKKVSASTERSEESVKSVKSQARKRAAKLKNVPKKGRQ